MGLHHQGGGRAKFGRDIGPDLGQQGRPGTLAPVDCLEQAPLAVVETALADHSDRDVARTLLLYVVGHTQATQLHRQAAAVGIVEADPDLDASFERGLAIILR